jgi:hypothetical protein
MEKSKKKTLFLGGTCCESKWREELIPMLEIDYFDPVVEDWTPDCMDEEIRQREQCDFVLYTITPEMKGVYSIAEVVDDSNKRPEKTVFCVIEEVDYPERGETFAFEKHQIKSLNAVKKMVAANGGTVCNTLQEVADFLNK